MGEESVNEVPSTISDSMKGMGGGSETLYLSPMKFSKQSNTAIEVSLFFVIGAVFMYFAEYR